MVKQQEKNFSTKANEMNYSYSPEFNQNNQTYIHLSESQIKNNIPFIPKALKFQHNNNQNNGNVLQNINLEEKFKSNDINKIIIPMNNTSDNHRKNSAGAESYSTCDEMSPVKPKKNKEKKTFPKKNKKKKGNKSPFKGEAKDFKIKYKTELCKYYECNGYCKYGDKCAYAHGIENLRSKVTNTTAYRTKKCTQFFEQGYCPYGNRCQFAHQLKSNIINNPYDKGMTYTKILETISKLENVGNIKKLVEKPRLAIFEEICKDEEGNESRLLDDIKKLNKSGLYKRVDNQN
jgi:butyrate response factor 1